MGGTVRIAEVRGVLGGRLVVLVARARRESTPTMAGCGRAHALLDVYRRLAVSQYRAPALTCPGKAACARESRVPSAETLVESRLAKAKVAGSNPVFRSKDRNGPVDDSWPGLFI